jgi:hypothetical protein
MTYENEMKGDGGPGAGKLYWVSYSTECAIGCKAVKIHPDEMHLFEYMVPPKPVEVGFAPVLEGDVVESIDCKVKCVGGE